jgi:polyhydroxybutyrate depolymerase
VPASVDRTVAAPVVLALHGGGSNPAAMADFCGLSQKANQEGFLVVYPHGSGRTGEYLSWNAGNCCGHAWKRGVNDVEFVHRLLDDLSEAAEVDARRVFATGMSNGGMLAYRLACEMPERIAAIAPVAGTLGLADCRPALPVPVLHFHGTKDLFVPYEGGKGPRSLSGTNFLPVREAIQTWVRNNECKPGPVETVLSEGKSDGMRITQHTYAGGRDGAEVALVTIEGGGHTWPGRLPRLAMLGPSAIGISANDMMWEFFQRHGRK